MDDNEILDLYFARFRAGDYGDGPEIRALLLQHRQSYFAEPIGCGEKASN